MKASAPAGGNLPALKVPKPKKETSTVVDDHDGADDDHDGADDHHDGADDHHDGADDDHDGADDEHHAARDEQQRLGQRRLHPDGRRGLGAPSGGAPAPQRRSLRASARRSW